MQVKGKIYIPNDNSRACYLDTLEYCQPAGNLCGTNPIQCVAVSEPYEVFVPDWNENRLFVNIIASDDEEMRVMRVLFYPFNVDAVLEERIARNIKNTEDNRRYYREEYLAGAQYYNDDPDLWDE